MSTLKVDDALIRSVDFTADTINVTMGDGAYYTRNINDFPNLRKGTPEQWLNYTIEGNGRWSHWEELDEDLSAEGFLK